MLQRIQSLPRQALLAIGAVAFVLILGVGFMLMKSSGGTVVVGTTTSSLQFQDWQNRLTAAKIPYTSDFQDQDHVKVKVPSAAKNAAQVALFVAQKPKVDTTSACKQPSAFSAGGSADDQYLECRDGAKIHDQLVNQPNILDAEVKVSAGENDDINASSDTNETATVHVTPEPNANLDGRLLAQEIRDDATYLDINNITLTNDADNQQLWPQTAQSGGTNACSITESNDITTRQNQIQACVESQITKQIQSVYPKLRSQVLATVTITPSAMQETVHQTSKGVPTEQSTTKGQGTQANNTSQTPSTTDKTISTIAGTVQNQQISVLLDNGTKAQVAAIETLLAAYNDKSQHSTLKVAAASTPAPAPAPKPAPVVTKAPHYTAPKTAVPHSIYLIGLLMAAAFVSIVFWMWQKQKRLQAEQESYQEAFRREQETLAAIDADEMALALEAMTASGGAPNPGPMLGV